MCSRQHSGNTYTASRSPATQALRLLLGTWLEGQLVHAAAGPPAEKVLPVHATHWPLDRPKPGAQPAASCFQAGGHGAMVVS